MRVTSISNEEAVTLVQRDHIQKTKSIKDEPSLCKNIWQFQFIRKNKTCG